MSLVSLKGEKKTNLWVNCTKEFKESVEKTNIKINLKHIKIQNIEQIHALIPEKEWIIMDVLLGIIRQELPSYCKEKISFNVPYFYGHKGICIVWPASIPRGGIKEGVLLGFWRGNELLDRDSYLHKGTNKKIFYRIFTEVEQLDQNTIKLLLKQAVKLDQKCL